jgi:hypothetical protein
MRRASGASRWAWGVGLVLASAAQAQPPVLNRPPADAKDQPGPPVLNRPIDGEPGGGARVSEPVAPITYPFYPPSGYTGPTSVLPTTVQGESDFVPVEDRWRTGMPAWDRYGKGHPITDDYPYDLGEIWNPYKQNVLKGDYPVIGQHTFFNLTASSFQLLDFRQTPIPAHGFEATADPNSRDFFGNPNQLAYNHFLTLTTELFHGDAAFKPLDWQIHLTQVFNYNSLNVNELSIVNPDSRDGTQRDRTFYSLEEYFVEAKLADLSPYYDFVSVRVGSQPFVSDFRGFLFSDINRAVRFFGTNFSNRDQFNLAFFRQADKDTNSGLNSFNDRGQNVLIANYYRQDFIFPGYTAQVSLHYNHDDGTMKFDRNNNLVRPDPAGTFQPHALDVCYLGWAGDGHIDRYNITHQVYYAFGHDTQNALANQAQDIRALFAAAELSYDRDWARFRVSALYSSGDHNINNHEATGFDTIIDQPVFAGGEFSYFRRQNVKLFGVNLVQGNSLIPDLRASKIQGQSNFVNPGLMLINAGADFDLTPKLKMINNVNVLWFDSTQVLEQFIFDNNIPSFIGTDISTGFEYRPLLSENIIMTFGASTLVPGTGFKALFDKVGASTPPLVTGFVELNLNY